MWEGRNTGQRCRNGGRTRTVNRALRKAYGIGIGSVEEIGSASRVRGNARALELVTNDSERRFLERRLREVQSPAA